jgi:hypothetical protein
MHWSNYGNGGQRIDMSRRMDNNAWKAKESYQLVLQGTATPMSDTPVHPFHAKPFLDLKLPNSNNGKLMHTSNIFSSYVRCQLKIESISVKGDLQDSE